jgi:hypothetical protein
MSPEQAAVGEMIGEFGIAKTIACARFWAAERDSKRQRRPAATSKLVARCGEQNAHILLPPSSASQGRSSLMISEHGVFTTEAADAERTWSELL